MAHTYRIIQDAIEIELEQGSAIPGILYLEDDIFKKLRSELIVKSTGSKVPETWTEVSIETHGHTLTVRADSWESLTVH